MAKILGYDKVYVTEYKTTCPKCGAVILFSEDEVEHTYKHHLKCGDEYDYTTATCPNCSNKLNFDKTKCAVKSEVSPKTEGQTLPMYDMSDKLHVFNKPSNCSGVCHRCQARCLARTEPFDERSF